MLKSMMKEYSCEDKLKESFLGRITIRVVGQYVAYNFEKYEEMKCEGCEEGWPSQRDHLCCMDENIISDREQKKCEYLKNIRDGIYIHWFTMQLASRCETEKVELSRVPRYLLYKTVEHWSAEILEEANKWREELLEEENYKN
jgi:hypothetical protein